MSDYAQQAAMLAALGHKPVLYINPADLDSTVQVDSGEVRTDERIEPGSALMFGEDADLSAEEQLEDEIELDRQEADDDV